MKILHVSFFSKESPASGGKICTIRNLEALYNLYGVQNVISYCVERNHNGSKSIVWKIKQFMSDIAKRQMNGLSDFHINKILEIIKKENVEIVFLDSSLLGQIGKKIKEYNHSVKIITFFHNVEYDFCTQLWEREKNLRNIYRPWVAKYNEKMACSTSDVFIALNKRDARRLYDLYHVNIDMLIPISIGDRFKTYTPHKVTKPINLLFIGSYFYANIEAVNYIKNKVLPYVEARLMVVGSGMDKLKNVGNKIEIYADVDDLTPYFQKADAMILPIFSGSGMKIKTCESMMHGKIIFGTNEAFEGYITSPTFAIKCNNDKEFIDSINAFQSNSNFSEDSRNNYLLHYSNECAFNLFKKILLS